MRTEIFVYLQPLARPRQKIEDNIQTDLKEIPATLRAILSWLWIRFKIVRIRFEHFCCISAVMPPA